MFRTAMLRSARSERVIMCKETGTVTPRNKGCCHALRAGAATVPTIIFCISMKVSINSSGLLRRLLTKAGITKRVGFHTFRHTYTTLLTQNGEDVKVVQELLRHANSRITLALYAQAGMAEKRLAQSKVVRQVLKRETAAV
jgi:integrase